MIIRLFLSLTLCVLFAFPQSSNAQTRRFENTAFNLCTNDEPRVVVKLATAPTKYIKTQNAQSLTAMHNTGQGVTLGLAGGPISITTKGQFQVTSQSGKACVELKNLEVLFWAKPQILIASNFQKGSCEYREVLAHEQKHIRTLRQFVKQQAPELKKEVRQIVKTSRVRYKVQENKISSAQKQIEQQIYSRLVAFQDKIMPILESRQKAIDTPEEYARVASKCDNWGKKLSSGH